MFLNYWRSVKMIDSQELLKELFPMSEESLFQTFTILKENDLSVKDFRFYLYKYMNEEDYHEIDFNSKSITSIFYWYVLEKLSCCHSDYFKNFILNNISVHDSLDFPIYTLNLVDNISKNKKAENIIRYFFCLELENEYLSKNKNLFFWFIKQINLDFLKQGYISDNDFYKFLKFDSKNSKETVSFPVQLKIF